LTDHFLDNICRAHHQTYPKLGLDSLPVLCSIVFSKQRSCL